MDLMDRKSDTEDTEIGDVQGKRETELPHSDAILELKNKILKLESWKTEIGATAIAECQKLRMDILEMKEKDNVVEIEMLSLGQENSRLQIELDTFSEEHHKWQNERKHLLNELNEVSFLNSVNQIEEANWALSCKEQYHKIDDLTDEHRRSNYNLIQTQRTISELLTQNQVITSNYNQLKKLNQQNEESLNNLKQKLKNTQNELKLLQTKYEKQSEQHLIEKEKYSSLYNDTIIKQLNEYSLSQNHKDEAIHIPHSAVSTPIRRRSRSIESDGPNDRFIINHIDTNLDEKEAFDILNIEKIRNEIEEELTLKFETEKQEMRDKYRKNEREAMRREQNDGDGKQCWLLPWVNGKCN